MKKIISSLLIITLLMSFIIPKPLMATESETGDYNAQESIVSTGKVNVNGIMQYVIDTPTELEAIGAILAGLTSQMALAVRGLLTVCVNSGNEENTGVFTIQELLYGKYNILNNDFLLNNSNSNNDIKDQVCGWYYGIRNLAIILGLLVLIYIGIRMAISTLADDKAKYKKMFNAWIQSFVLIFFLHYIMIIAMTLQKALMDILMGIDIGNVNPEKTIASSCVLGIAKANGMNIVWYGILYWVLTYYQVKFFLLYTKRMVSTAFLIVIAPLITITYSIDKVGDNKAQAFGAWLKEFLVNIFIQPLHIVIYLIFIVTASELAIVMPLFTMIFFGALSRGEKIVKGLFGMRGMKSINSMGKRKKKK